MAKITVRACEGRTVPFHQSVASRPGGGDTSLKPGETIEVENSSFIRRRIRSGDLEIVPENNNPAKHELPVGSGLPPTVVVAPSREKV